LRCEANETPITRVSLTPFDLRGNIPTDKMKEISLALCGNSLLSVGRQHLTEPGLAVLPIDQSHTIVLSPDGFGLSIEREVTVFKGLEDFPSIAQLLINRGSHHRDIRMSQGVGAVGVGQIKEVLRKSTKKHEIVRPPIWEASPYAFSFFYIEQSAERLLTSSAAEQGLSALLEPSQLNTSSSGNSELEAQSLAKSISNLNAESLLTKYHDVDIKAGCVALCSWAGIVFFDDSGLDLEYFETLEIRLQFAWLRAHFVRTWAESVDSQGKQTAELIEYGQQTRPLLRKSRRLINSTVSTRDEKLFAELVRTSELSREINSAEDALFDVEERIKNQQDTSRRKYDRTIEALLLILAVLQVIPLLIETPFAQLTPRWLPVIAGPLMVLLWIRQRNS
jgi:hypothetical protein